MCKLVADSVSLHETCCSHVSTQLIEKLYDAILTYSSNAKRSAYSCRFRSNTRAMVDNVVPVLENLDLQDNKKVFKQ